MACSYPFHGEQEEIGKMPQGMHIRIGIVPLLLAVLTLLIPMSATALNVGDKAPDFLAFSTVGEQVRLSDYQGKKNVLMFFFVRAFGGV
jgi:hypothetical protein